MADRINVHIPEEDLSLMNIFSKLRGLYKPHNVLINNKEIESTIILIYRKSSDTIRGGFPRHLSQPVALILELQDIGSKTSIVQ